MNWVGDFNPQMMHLMDYLSAKAVKTHITYRKLFRCDDTKSLCMQFESVVTNSTLTFSAVSYTHLDVYKRQHLRWIRGAKPLF